jgi:two-component system, cell cycle sensor histidine kinase and response regulator CckA
MRSTSTTPSPQVKTQLNNLMRRWPGIVFSQRPDFTIHCASPKIEELTGISPAEWQREPARFWQLVHEADAAELQQQLKRVAESDQVVTSAYRIRHHNTGQVAYLLEQREAVRSGSGLLLGYEAAWLDVTRQTIAESRLAGAAWKETLAVLTTGLAHDFSNIMAGIHSLSEGFQAQIEKGHPFQEGLALIQLNSRKASELINRLVNLHRGEIGQKNYHDLNELVADMVELLRKVVPRRIQIETTLAKDSLPLYVDAVEFRRVFVNLTLNAVEAMPQAGRLSLETLRHNQVPPLQHRHGPSPRAPAICLSVRDTGSGIPARNIGKIFDPFFTTKALNKGSGLGLSNARLFVERHHGAISVESEERGGATFRLWLPQADFTEAEQEPARRPRRRHTLLLLGQRADLLDATAQLMREHGFYVVQQSEEERAREILGSADYELSGVMVQATAGDPLPGALLAQIRQQRLASKVILQIVGCNQDELPAQFLELADLVVSADSSTTDLLARLNSLFDGTA